ncbi:MAG: CPBP family intramembrane metalloprotease [Treponema sp.]|nr:CPBP family intramembrane metalloprotease [Treponema sp.]
MVQMATNLSFGIITLPQFAPTMAYILIIILFRNLYRPITVKINKIVLVKSFIAIIFPLALFTLAFYVGKLTGMDVNIGNNLFSIVTIGILGIIIGAVTEEIGWRSFFQPALEQKHSVFISSVIVGLIWGIWHIGHFMNGPIFMSGFLIFTISVSITIAFLYKNTQYNIIILSLFHASINMGFTIYFTNGFENIRFFFIISIVWLITAIIILICGRKYFFIKAKYNGT